MRLPYGKGNNTSGLIIRKWRPNSLLNCTERILPMLYNVLEYEYFPGIKKDFLKSPQMKSIKKYDRMCLVIKSA
jgi:hypothetical protein